MTNHSVEKAKLEEKLAKRRGERVAQEFVAELERLDKEGLEAKFLDYCKTEQGIINTRNADTVLAELRAKSREQNAKHNEQLIANKELRRLVAIIISEKFGDELMDRTVESEESEEDSDEVEEL